MRDLVEVHGLAKSIFNSLEVHRQFYCANSSSLKEITKSDHYSVYCNIVLCMFLTASNVVRAVLRITLLLLLLFLFLLFSTF